MLLEVLHLDNHALRVQTDCGQVRLDELRDELGRLIPQIIVQCEVGFWLECLPQGTHTLVIRVQDRKNFPLSDLPN